MQIPKIIFEELDKMLINYKSISLIREKGGVHLYRINTVDGFYV